MDYWGSSAVSVPDVVDLDLNLDSLDVMADFNDDIDIDLDSMVDPFRGASPSPMGHNSGLEDLHREDLMMSLMNLDVNSMLESVDAGLVEFSPVKSDKRSFAGDDEYDTKDIVRQDCMWSSGPNFPKVMKMDKDYSCENKVNYSYAGVSRVHAGAASKGMMGTTPPTSYINECEPYLSPPFASSDDDSSSCFSGDDDTNLTAMSRLSMSLLSTVKEEQRLPSPTVMAGRDLFTNLEHSYFSTAPSARLTSAGNQIGLSPLTPAESSEDEEVSPGLLKRYKLSAATPIHADTKKDILVKKPVMIRDVHSLLKSSSSSSIALASNSMPKNDSSKNPKFSFKINIKTKAYKCIGEGSDKRRVVKVSTAPDSLAPPTQMARQQHAKSPLPKNPEKVNQRHIHNHMERQRRTDLKNAFDTLKLKIPDIRQNDRASKQMILDSAIQYCTLLKGKEEQLGSSHKNALHVNEILKKRLLALQAS